MCHVHLSNHSCGGVFEKGWLGRHESAQTPTEPPLVANCHHVPGHPKYGAIVSEQVILQPETQVKEEAGTNRGMDDNRQ